MTRNSSLMEAPRISFCIPTYNRSALLAQALSTLLEQCRTDLSSAQRSQVEIVVSDNCSPDNTSAVVEGMVTAYPELCLTYFRQPENRGGDANILHTMQMGRGEFVYLLSDDDLLLPGAVAKLFALMETHPEADGFFLNTRSFVEDICEKTLPNFRLTEDLQIVGKDASLLFFGTWITFISALAFRRSRIAGKLYEGRIGTFLVQSYFYLDFLAEARSIVATNEPFLGVRGYNSGGFSFFEVFVTQFRALLFHAEELGFSQHVLAAVSKRHLRSYLAPHIIAFRIRDDMGTFRPDIRDAAGRLFTVYGKSPFLLFGLLPVLVMPRRLLQTLHRSLKWLRTIYRLGKS
jgi:glycosyltransferase involved in cell wall biosynthesis